MYRFETTRYWPKWMQVYYPNSLLKSFHDSVWVDQAISLDKTLDDYIGSISYNTFGQLRVAWKIYSDSNLITTVTYNNSSLFRCTSDYDFLTSLVPCYYLYFDGSIYLRNLETVVISGTPDSNFNIQLGPITEDVDIYYNSSNIWERLRAQSIYIDYSSNKILLPNHLPTTAIYSNKTNLVNIDTSGSVSINDGPLKKLIPVDLENCWDNTATLWFTSRLPRETNYHLYKRINYYNHLPKDELSGMGEELDLLNKFTWDGTTSTSVTGTILKIDETNIVNNRVEKVKASSPTVYKLTQTPIPGTVLVYINGQVQVPYSISGNVVTLYNDPLSDIVVVYRYYVYNFANNTLTNNQTTLPTYNVYYVKGLKKYQLARDPNILSPNGTASDYGKRVVREIKEKVNSTIGFTNWGKTHWFEETEIKPEVTYLPRVLDND